MSSSHPWLFVGLGSPHGDDQIGWRVADRLAETDSLPTGLSIRKAAIPLDILDWLKDVAVLILCDAAETPGETGAIDRWEWTANLEPFSTTTLSPMLDHVRGRGSHDFGLVDVLNLAARLECLPGKIVLWTISAKHFEAGQLLSENLQHKLPLVCNTILSDLRLA